MGSLLASQIRSYVREASQAAAAWQASHREAMACRDVEDLIAVGLALLETAEKSAARPLPPDTPPDRAAAIRRDYWELGRDFDAHFDRIATLVGEVEQRGFRVEGADRLRDARGFLKAALSVTPEGLAEAEEDIRQGRVAPAAEVRDGIRRRLQQEG